MRVKLQFDDKLTSSPFPKCLYFIDEKEIKNIQKLEEKLKKDFNFLKKLKRGFQLEIDDFVLPSNQPIDIITQLDIIK